MWQSFAAIGRETAEISRWIKQECRAVATPNFFSFNIKNIIFRKILSNAVPLQRIYTTVKLLNIFPYYYNISDNILKYANYLIKYAAMHDTKMSQAEMDSTRKKYSRISWEKFGSDDYQIVIALALSITEWHSKITMHWKIL